MTDFWVSCDFIVNLGPGKQEKVVQMGVVLVSMIVTPTCSYMSAHLLTIFNLDHPGTKLLISFVNHNIRNCEL